MKDTKMIRQCLKGNRKAINELYQLLFNPLMRICVRYKNNEHEAVAALNSGFLKIIDNLEKFDEQRDVVAWSARIMIRCLIDEFRLEKANKMHANTSYFDENYVFDEHINYNDFETSIEAEDLREMLKQLPSVTRHVFNLFALDGFSHKEIAVQLEIKEVTSRWHLSEARRRLQAMLVHRFENSEKKTTIDVE